MSAIPMICEKCGGTLEYSSEKGKYVCQSCDTGYILTEDTDFKIVADVLIKYRGRSSYVRVPEGVREIKVDAFSGLRVIEVVLPSTLENFNTEIFNYCPDIQRITISEGIQTISGDGCHMNGYECEVEEIELPGSITDIYNNPFSHYGVKRLKINRDFDYYFETTDYRPFEMSVDGLLYVPITKYPWCWTSLETVITPTGEIDYKIYSEECHEKYLIAKKEVDDIKAEKARQKALMEEEKEAEEKRKEEEQKMEEEKAKLLKEQEMAKKRAKTSSNMSIVAFCLSVIGIVIFPLSFVSLGMGIADFFSLDGKGRNHIFAILAIVLGIFGAIFGRYIVIMMLNEFLENYSKMLYK